MNMETFQNWEEAAAHVAEQAPHVERLERLEEVMDAEIHGVWLDETTATVWHAWADSDVHGHLTGTWYLGSEEASDAAAWLEEAAMPCLDALADPESSYDTGHRTPTDDLEVQDELNRVRLAALRADAQQRIDTLGEKLAGEVALGWVVDGQIQAGIARARAEVARWAGLRAHHLRSYADTGRGGQARAARELGISSVTVHNVIKDDDRRRDQLIAAADTSTTITTSVRNTSGAWEVIDREPGDSLDNAEASAHDIGGHPGQPLRIELRDAHDDVIDSVEITAS